MKALISLFAVMVRPVFSASAGTMVIFCAFENVPESPEISAGPKPGRPHHVRAAEEDSGQGASTAAVLLYFLEKSLLS